MIESNPLIVALDVSSWEELERILDELAGEVSLVKVGLEAFSALGPQVIDYLGERGYGVFLDLKLHDIPHTIQGAVRSLAARRVKMLTLHALGGRRMLGAARKALEEMVLQPEERPLLLAVTLLTSLEEEELVEMGWSGGGDRVVVRLAEVALEAGMDGLVASARELPVLRSIFGEKPTIVVPGIRDVLLPGDDQRRTARPAEVIRSGADFLVVGRPIVQSVNPRQRAREIREEIERTRKGMQEETGFKKGEKG